MTDAVTHHADSVTHHAIPDAADKASNRCKRLGHSIGAWPAQLAHAFVQWRGRFTARSTHKSDRFLHQRAVGFVHAPRAILKPDTRTCPPRATAGASSGRMSRPRASNHPRHRATSAQPQSLKRRDPAYVFSAPGRGIAILILPGGPLRFQIGEVTGVSTC